MTFVNMHSPGLKILATHRLVGGLDGFDAEAFLRRAEKDFRVERVDSLDAIQRRWQEGGDKTYIGVALADKLYLLEARDAGQLDVRVLHDVLLAKTLGIGEEAVREEKNLRYIRGLDAALEETRKGGAQAAFLLKPTSIQQVADISFGGGVM